MKWDPEKEQWQRQPAEGPPDLEKVLKKLFRSKSKKNQKTPPNVVSFFACLLLVAFLYCLSGFYIVGESERAVSLRLGKIHQSLEPGLHWRARWIDKVYVVNTQSIESFQKKSTMLTEDENLVALGFEVQYRRNNPEMFLFQDQNPILTLHQLTESCIRDVIGHRKLDDILTTGKQSITGAIRDLIVQSLSMYKLGIEVVDINLSFALPPEQVQPAFNDVIKAREDEQAYQNEALRYRASQIPVALGKAQRILFDANGYCESRLLHAQSQAKAFLLLSDQDILNPELMRKRLYHETIDTAMQKPKKILIDPNLSSPVLSLGNLSQLPQQNVVHADKELLTHE